MVKKILLKDFDGNELLPITRGELILDPSGKMALRSTLYLATSTLPGLMSPEDRYKIDNMSASSVAHDLVLKIKSGTVEGTDLYTFNGSADKILDFQQGSGITLLPEANKMTISNSGVRAISESNVNGTISVNTNGTVANVSIKGLGSAAFTASSVYSVRLQLINEDLNNIITPGFYNAGSGNSVTNKPSNIDNFGLIVIHSATDSHYILLLFIGEVVWRRHCISGEWSVWKKDECYNVVSSTSNGLAPMIGTESASTIGSQSNEWVLASTSGATPTWRKLPSNAFNNTTYTLSGALSAGGFTTTLTSSTGSTSTSTVPIMGGATSSASGSVGLVPTPSSNTAFLRGDGTWTTPLDTHYTTHLYIGAINSASNSSTTNGNTYIKLFDNSTLRHLYKITGGGVTTVNSDSDGNLTISSSVKWSDISDKPPTFTPSTHNHPSSQITSLTGYSKATSPSNLSTTDTLNSALGKLEYKSNLTYDWYLSITQEDTDDIINKWGEIVDFIDSVAEGTDITDEFVTRKTALTIIGKKTFSNGIAITSADSNNLMPYFLGIDAFADGGTVKYITASQVANAIGALTLHQSLANYVTLNTAQTITGAKTFAANTLTISNPNGGDATLKFYRGGNTAWSIVDTVGNLMFNDLVSNTTRLVLYESAQGGSAAFGGSVTASKFITNGGTSSQFVKGDGSLDSTNYATTSSLGNYVTLNTDQEITGIKTFANNLILSNGSSTESPHLIFQRGTTTDDYYDYHIYSQDGKICFGYSYSGLSSYVEMAKIGYTGDITAIKFIKSGGTASQFLKADGSVDSNTYATTTLLGLYLPLSGGTLQKNSPSILIINNTNSSTSSGSQYSGVRFSWNGTIVSGIHGRNGSETLWRSNASFNTAYEIFDTGNYTSWVPKKDGTGATGTWGISISGTASKATNDVDGNAFKTTYLRKVTVARNTENDFNTFENMTLTGRGDPLTGASLKNAPWTGSGPAGGYGVLTYLWCSYGTQMAWGYNNNRIYIRNRYYGSGVGSVWSTTWDSLALTSDIPTVTNYYWANVPVSATSSTTTKPTFGGAIINGKLTINNSSSAAELITLTTTNSSYNCISYQPPSSSGYSWSVGITDNGYYLWNAKKRDHVFDVDNDGNINIAGTTTAKGSIYTVQPSANRRVGIIGSYDPNRAAAIWSMGSYYQIAADGTTLGNLYGAAYVYYGSGYTFGAGKSGGHSFVWAQNGNPTVALGDYVWAANGFTKKGSSDSYVLLGGGGHKTIASFQTTYDGRYVKKAGDTMTGALTMNAGTGLVMYYSGNDSGSDPWITLNGYPYYGIRYFNSSVDKLTISATGNGNDVSKADLCINGNGDGTVTIRGNNIWHAGNDGSGSGLDADMLDGLHIHTGRNSEANKVVRTDANGYILAGWINTTSGAFTGTPSRIYASDDAYIRYMTPANFFPTLTNDDDLLSITVGGLNRKLTIAHATNSDKLRVVSCYNGTTNNDLWSTIKTSDSSYLGTSTMYEVYNDGGPTTYGHILDTVSVHGNHWQSQLWMASGKTGRLYYRNKDYNDDTWGGWRPVAWTSDIPNPANYYWANIKVSASSSTSTSPTFQECYANGWFRSTGNNGWYNPTHNSHIHPNGTTTYGNLVVRGAKSYYTGINLGNSTSHMTVMSTAEHHGLYCEANEVWEFYYNKSSSGVGIRTATITKNFNVNGQSYLSSNTWIGTTSGEEMLNVGGWIGTVGSTGWYSVTHKGGWYMTESTWIRNYNNKPVLISVSTYPSIECNASSGSESNLRFAIAGTVKGYVGFHNSYGTFLYNSSAGKYVYVNNSGYFYTQSYINVGAGNEKNASNPPYVWGVNGSDNFMRTYATSSLSVGYAANADYATSAPAAANYGSTGNATKIKIKINSTASWMLSFVVTIYLGYKSSKIMVSGYNYGSNYWYEPKAVLLGDSNGATSIPVYFGYDSAFNLWVGFDGGSYTGVSVSDVTNGYTQISSLKGLFTISNVSSLTTLQKTVTATNSVNYAVSARSASSASKLGSSTVGGTYLPIYLSAGTATAGTSYAKAIKAITRSGTTFTYTCLDGSTGTFTLLDNNTTYNFSGVSFTSGSSSTGTHNCNSITSNGVWYYTENGPTTTLGASTTDGALYSQAYSSSWVAQIAQDYRDGDLFTRGRNNGTWTAWKRVAYFSEITKANVGLGNVQNTAFYPRSTTVNGTAWNMAGTINSAAFTIYAPTTVGTSGYVLQSNGSGAPSWVALSTLSVSYSASTGALGRADVGSATQPIYLDSGVPKACTAYASASVNYANSAGVASKVSGTLKFVGGTFATATYNGSANVSVNIPTSTSHLTNDNNFVHRSNSTSAVGNMTKPVYVTSTGLVSACTYGLASNVNGGLVNKLAYYGATNLIDDYTSSVGSATKPMYLSAGIPTACTYSLSATVNSGTSGKLVRYSGTNAISSYTSDVGSSNRPVYINEGVPTAITIAASTSTLYVLGTTTSNTLCKGGSSTTTGVHITSGKVLNAPGGFYETSDARLKNFISDINIDFDKLRAIPKKYFTWKNKNKVNIGTSALELLKIYPEIVNEGEDGILTVAYDKLSIIALKAIDLLYDEILKLRLRIKTLEENK